MLQGLYEDQAVTKVACTPTITSVTRITWGHAVIKVTYTPTIASFTSLIRGACCDQGNILIYKCKCYKGFTGSKL